MKRVMIVLLALISMLHLPCCAADKDGEELLSYISRTPQTITQVKITSLIGTPTRIEESKKMTLWYYTLGSSNLVISWNKKSEMPEKVSFNSEPAMNCVFDKALSCKLKSGHTDVTQALKILGTPKTMTLKTSTQVLNYAYKNKMLRLFFRDRMLVDFCLY